MGTTLTQGGGQGVMAPPGNHRAICCGVIDLGTQSFEFAGEAKSLHKLMIRWELSDEPAPSDGRPLQISREFTASLHEKSALRPFLEGWRGRAFTPQELAGFDPAVLLGQPCLLSVVHQTSAKGRTFADVASAGRLPKGMAPPEAVADQVHYQIEDGDPPQELPEWVLKKINASAERQALAPAAVPVRSGIDAATIATEDLTDNSAPPF